MLPREAGLNRRSDRLPVRAAQRLSEEIHNDGGTLTLGNSQRGSTPPQRTGKVHLVSLIVPWSPGCCPHLTFGGSRVCHCSACHETFSGIYAFDMHKLMDGCRKPSDCGLIRGGDRVWHWPPKESLIKWLAKV